jgi:hypothetical protein
LKILMLLALACLSGCSWFHPRAKLMPEPPELIVTGAPAGSALYIDGAQTGETATSNDKPRVLAVAAGEHIVEVHLGSSVVYREQTYVGSGERRVIKVLSGSSRE